MSILYNCPVISRNESVLLDTKAVEINNIPSIVLMEEAASQIVKELHKDFSNFKSEKLLILCGWGNNAGDALSVARRLHFKKIDCHIALFNDKNGSALYNEQLKIIRTLPLDILDINKLESYISDYTLIIDGIFGIGYRYREDKIIENIFDIVNESEAIKVSIDTPSGLNSDLHTAVKADYTYSIGFNKDYFFNINSRRNCGRIKNLKISFDIHNITPSQNISYIRKIKRNNKKPDDFVHKYSRGGAISIGGDKGKFGSIVFSGESAFKTGCGISLIITGDNNIVPLNTITKNLIVDSFEKTEEHIDKYNSVLIGPGLAFNNEQEKKIVEKIVRRADKQFILDASFFNLFDKSLLKKFDSPPILTPHAGEFKKFFKDESSLLNTDTIKTIAQTAKKYNSFIILKDSYLVIGTPGGKAYIYDRTDRIFAQAGSGDILSGILAGITSQGEYSALEAIFESIRLFYKAGTIIKKLNYKTYSPDLFIDILGKNI